MTQLAALRAAAAAKSAGSTLALQRAEVVSALRGFANDYAGQAWQRVSVPVKLGH